MQNLCHFLEKISFVKIYALCRKIHFVAIYALLCGEKFIQKFSLWRKNDKYEVWFKASRTGFEFWHKDTYDSDVEMDQFFNSDNSSAEGLADAAFI